MDTLEALAFGIILPSRIQHRNGELITIKEGMKLLRKKFPNKIGKIENLTDVNNFEKVRDCGFPVVFARDLNYFIDRNETYLIAIKGAGTREEGDRLVGFYFRGFD